MSRLRVVVLGCKECPPFEDASVHSGGMEAYAHRMMHSLSDRAAFTVYAVKGRSEAGVRVESLGAAAGLRTQPVTLLARSLRQISRDRGRFDLANPQTPLSGLAARYAKRRFGLPYVATVHSFGGDPAHTGSRPAAAVYAAVERLVFRDADRIIVTGQKLGRYVASFGVEDRLRVVSAAGEGVVEAVDPQAGRARMGVDADQPTALFLGRLIEENGIDDLLEAFAIVRRSLPRAALVFAGVGDRREAIVARVRQLGLDDAVRLIGSIGGQEKLDAIAGSECLVRTSFHEVFPEAYVESLGVGTPVVATPAGDTDVLAESSGAVELVPMSDPPAQAAGLLRVLGDPERRAAMRERALDYSRRVTWSLRKEDYWDALREAAGRTGTRAA